MTNNRKRRAIPSSGEGRLGRGFKAYHQRLRRGLHSQKGQLKLPGMNRWKELLNKGRW